MQKLNATKTESGFTFVPNKPAGRLINTNIHKRCESKLLRTAGDSSDSQGRGQGLLATSLHWPYSKTVMESFQRFLRIGIAAFCASTMASGAATTEFSPRSSTLPRIRITADGRGFETEQGKYFVPFGVNYFRPGQGWAPQLWKKFDADATRKDFALMKEFGINCVRVFLTYGSFMTETNRVAMEGLAKFDEFLTLAEEASIYVHPTGPDHWERLPEWAKGDRIADDVVLRALEGFWRQFAARYRGRSVVFAYDLLNEPEVKWDTQPMREKWNRWLEKQYGSADKLAEVWALTNHKLTLGSIPVPAKEDCAGCAQLLTFQSFREEIADAWTRRQVAVIKSTDP